MACKEQAMYKIKPVFKLNDLTISSPMYSLKNIQNFSACNVNGRTRNESSEDALLDQVEAKQESLLKIISEINVLLATLKKELAAPKIDSRPCAEANMVLPSPEFSKLGIVHEVVLNASVKHPPNSLLILHHLWGNVDFQFTWHIHSSAKGLPKTLKKFENINGHTINKNPHLRIRIVWKEVWSDCELVVSPLNAVPLLGEVNFLRFLNRYITGKEEADPFKLAYLESKLDACHSLSYCDNIQQSQEYYNILSDGLDKSKWLVGDNISIVDLACWSVINNMKSPNLNPLLSRWYKDFDSLVSKNK